MKNLLIVLSMTISLCTGINAQAEEKADVLQGFMNSCKSDIENYCNQVVRVDGRLLACIYAHEDKLSIECQYDMYKAATTLSGLASTFTKIALSCEDDIPKHCGEIKPGEGRLLTCMKEKQKLVSEDCSKALSAVETE